VFISSKTSAPWEVTVSVSDLEVGTVLGVKAAVKSGSGAYETTTVFGGVVVAAPTLSPIGQPTAPTFKPTTGQPIGEPTGIPTGAPTGEPTGEQASGRGFYSYALFDPVSAHAMVIEYTRG
jgi:hypothetical protein